MLATACLVGLNGIACGASLAEMWAKREGKNWEGKAQIVQKATAGLSLALFALGAVKSGNGVWAAAGVLPLVAVGGTPLFGQIVHVRCEDDETWTGRVERTGNLQLVVCRIVNVALVIVTAMQFNGTVRHAVLLSSVAHVTPYFVKRPTNDDADDAI